GSTPASRSWPQWGSESSGPPVATAGPDDSLVRAPFEQRDAQERRQPGGDLPGERPVALGAQVRPVARRELQHEVHLPQLDPHAAAEPHLPQGQPLHPDHLPQRPHAHRSHQPPVGDGSGLLVEPNRLRHADQAHADEHHRENQSHRADEDCPDALPEPGRQRRDPLPDDRADVGREDPYAEADEDQPEYPRPDRRPEDELRLGVPDEPQLPEVRVPGGRPRRGCSHRPVPAAGVKLLGDDGDGLRLEQAEHDHAASRQPLCCPGETRAIIPRSRGARTPRVAPGHPRSPCENGLMPPEPAPQTPTVWTIKALLAWTTEFLTKKGNPSARLEAQVLLAHVLNCPR